MSIPSLATTSSLIKNQVIDAKTAKEPIKIIFNKAQAILKIIFDKTQAILKIFFD